MMKCGVFESLIRLLFAIARAANARLGVPDVEYKRGGQVFR